MLGNGEMFSRLNAQARGRKPNTKSTMRRDMARWLSGLTTTVSRKGLRRDMTTRDDYHTVDAVNRRVITPWGWVHEQDNSKLMLNAEPQVLVREVGLNTYRAFDDYPVAAAEDYWAGIEEFWAGVRAEWKRVAEANDHFAITIKGETEALYMPLLDLATAVNDGKKMSSLHS